MDRAETAITQRRWWPALGISVAVHTGIAALLWWAPIDQNYVEPLVRRYVTVSFERRAAQPIIQSTPSPQDEVNGEGAALNDGFSTGNGSLTLDKNSSSQPAESSLTPTPTPTLAADTQEQRVSKSVAPMRQTNPSLQDSAANRASSSDTVRSVPAATLRAQITTVLQKQREAQTQQFTESCWFSAQQPKRDDCSAPMDSDRGGDSAVRTQVAATFRGVERVARDERINATLEARAVMLERLEASGGFLGDLARQRRAIDNEYRAYLNGNANLAIQNFVRSTTPYMGNTPINSNFLQFTCALVPCIYEFTGFAVVKPQALIDAEAEADTFRVKPTLFTPLKWPQLSQP